MKSIRNLISHQNVTRLFISTEAAHYNSAPFFNSDANNLTTTSRSVGLSCYLENFMHQLSIDSVKFTSNFDQLCWYRRVCSLKLWKMFDSFRIILCATDNIVVSFKHFGLTFILDSSCWVNFKAFKEQWYNIYRLYIYIYYNLLNILSVQVIPYARFCEPFSWQE